MTTLITGSNLSTTSASLTTPLPEASGGTNSATVLAATKAALNASGSAPVYGCRAWCTFNGATTGTNAPTAGGNVTSVTRTSAGLYTINFTTALPDANYAVIGTTTYQAAGGTPLGTVHIDANSTGVPTLKTTSAVTISTHYTSSVAYADYGLVHVAVFG